MRACVCICVCVCDYLVKKNAPRVPALAASILPRRPARPWYQNRSAKEKEERMSARLILNGLPRARRTAG